MRSGASGLRRTANAAKGNEGSTDGNHEDGEELTPGEAQDALRAGVWLADELQADTSHGVEDEKQAGENAVGEPWVAQAQGQKDG